MSQCLHSPRKASWLAGATRGQRAQHLAAVVEPVHAGALGRAVPDEGLRPERRVLREQHRRPYAARGDIIRARRLRSQNRLSLYAPGGQAVFNGGIPAPKSQDVGSSVTPLCFTSRV